MAGAMDKVLLDWIEGELDRIERELDGDGMENYRERVLLGGKLNALLESLLQSEITARQKETYRAKIIKTRTRLLSFTDYYSNKTRPVSLGYMPQ